MPYNTVPISLDFCRPKLLPPVDCTASGGEHRDTSHDPIPKKITATVNPAALQRHKNSPSMPTSTHPRPPCHSASEAHLPEPAVLHIRRRHHHQTATRRLLQLRIFRSSVRYSRVASLHSAFSPVGIDGTHRLLMLHFHCYY
ncbi:uncharacterized protein [Triticum aestivum]|uniref:uncharacterized protein n=1 Tax=Triticum aestivum TaxID=4565 RepID=UPI001D019997|nr:uncharacterized protein LOC123134161 [Triticum aestivum]